MTTINDLIVVGFYGEKCIPESDLDAAFSLAEKGLNVPWTCFAPDTTITKDMLSHWLGHEPTGPEMATIVWAICGHGQHKGNPWCQEGSTWPPHWPGHEHTIPQTPISSSGLILALAFCTLLAYKRITK